MRCSTWPRSSAAAGNRAMRRSRSAPRSRSTSKKATWFPRGEPARSWRGLVPQAAPASWTSRRSDCLQRHGMPPPDDPLLALFLDHGDGHREGILALLQVAVLDSCDRQPPAALVVLRVLLKPELMFRLPQEAMGVRVVLGHLRCGHVVSVARGVALEDPRAELEDLLLVGIEGAACDHDTVLDLQLVVKLHHGGPPPIRGVGTCRARPTLTRTRSPYQHPIGPRRGAPPRSRGNDPRQRHTASLVMAPATRVAVCAKHAGHEPHRAD